MTTGCEGIMTALDQPAHVDGFDHQPSLRGDAVRALEAGDHIGRGLRNDRSVIGPERSKIGQVEVVLHRACAGYHVGRSTNVGQRPGLETSTVRAICHATSKSGDSVCV